MNRYQIYLLDAFQKRLGEVLAYKTLDAHLLFNDVGKWILTGTAQYLDDLIWGGPAVGIEIVRNGVSILTGCKKHIKVNRDRSGGIIEASGGDDNQYLKARLAYPVPSGPPYTSSAYDSQSGLAEAIIKHYVSYNVGPNATVQRQVPGLSIEPDYARGTVIPANARFDVLLTLLQSLALQGGDLGFKIVKGIFSIYQPADKSQTIRFSFDLGNLQSYEYIVDAPSENYYIVAGGQEGVNRIFTEGGDADSILAYGRMEGFYDCRSTTDILTLTSNLSEQLAKSASVVSVKLKTIDLPGRSAITDYWLGDQVKAVLQEGTVTGIIREIDISLDDAGEHIDTVISTPNAKTEMLDGLYSRLRNLDARIGSLERR
jgi:hypothetical protein